MLNNCPQSQDYEGEERRKGCFLKNTMDKEIINTDKEIQAIHTEIHDIKTSADKRDRKMTIIFWMGVVSIALGAIKIAIELYGSSGNLNG